MEGFFLSLAHMTGIRANGPFECKKLRRMFRGRRVSRDWECSAPFSEMDVNYPDPDDGAVAQMDRAAVS
jgi:hypothetical protein